MKKKSKSSFRAPPIEKIGSYLAPTGKGRMVIRLGGEKKWIRKDK